MPDTAPTLLHNPRCSKSREALALLQARGVNAQLRLYQDVPLDRDELTRLIASLGERAPDLIRPADARKRGLSDDPAAMDAQALCIWLAEHPETMQRPVLISGDRAIIGRPPQDILRLIDDPKG